MKLSACSCDLGTVYGISFYAGKGTLDGKRIVHSLLRQANDVACAVVTFLVVAHHGVHAALHLSSQPRPRSKLCRTGWILEVRMTVFRLREQ